MAAMEVDVRALVRDATDMEGRKEGKGGREGGFQDGAMGWFRECWVRDAVCRRRGRSLDCWSGGVSFQEHCGVLDGGKLVMLGTTAFGDFWVR